MDIYLQYGVGRYDMSCTGRYGVPRHVMLAIYTVSVRSSVLRGESDKMNYKSSLAKFTSLGIHSSADVQVISPDRVFTLLSR